MDYSVRSRPGIAHSIHPPPESPHRSPPRPARAGVGLVEGEITRPTAADRVQVVSDGDERQATPTNRHRWAGFPSILARQIPLTQAPPDLPGEFTPRGDRIAPRRPP